MAENSKIEWTDHTFNPWIGCAKVSPGCKNCYAENLMDKRYGRVQWGVNGTRSRTSVSTWKQPLKWNRQAEKEGRRYRVFCASLADVFEDRPELVEWRADLFRLIDATPNLDWLLLTKRPENIEWMWPNLGPVSERPRTNIGIGTSVEDQAAADTRIQELLKVAHLCKFTFLSCEPLLGPVNLHPWLCSYGDTASPEQMMSGVCEPSHKINWVICGGESGPGARPMHPQWAQQLRNDCEDAEVPFLFKQWGEYNEHGEKVGKHASGRLLDGVEHNGFPA
jgi:protein gp37